MPDTVLSAASVQRDRRHWESDISMWRDDVGVWRDLHSTSLIEPKRLQERLAEHCDAFETRVGQLDAHDKTFRADVHEVAEACRSGEQSVADSSAQDHVKEAEQPKHLGDSHDRIQKHHHTVIAHVGVLRAALDAAL